MTRDHKNSRPTAGGGGSVWAGILIGLVLGIALAVAVALYLQRHPVPFGPQGTTPNVNSSAPTPELIKPEILSPNGTPQPSSPLPAPTTNNPGLVNSPPKPSYDFYHLLPELGQPEKNTPTPSPTANPSDRSFLQVGAFKEAQDADDLKAKLALMGMEAHIQTADLAAQGIWHRVRIGPLLSKEETERIHLQLKEAGIAATLIKAP